MTNSVKMSASALRAIMGEEFDWDEYEEGRKDWRNLIKKSPDIRNDKIAEVKRILERGDFRQHCPGPSYWIGCLCESDFTF